MINNINNVLNSRLRFTGLASGLDTDTIIKQMMMIDSMKVDRARQDKQILEWRRDDYRSITNALRGFKDEFFDILKPDTYMRSANSYFSYKVTSSDESIVTASGNSQVSMLEHKIKVSQLAETATLETANDIFGETGLSINSKISKVAEEYDLELENNKLTFTINDKIIEISGDKKISDLVGEINNSHANVKMAYRSFLDKFTINTKATGAEAKINISDETGFFEKIGFDISNEVKGKDAQFELDGKPASRNSNIFTIDGVTYTLKAVSKEDDEPIKISLSQDTDAIFDKIKSFVDKYNELIDKISSKINEERPKAGGRYGSYYLPLTEEQKDSMKDTEIEKWEENAKKGLIKGDSILSGILFDLRRAMGDITESGTLSSIGISTGDWRDGAKLFIDEEKLKKAINDNPDKIKDIFAKQSDISYSPDATAAERKQRYAESGVVDRIFDILQDNIRTTRNKNGKKGVLLEKAGIVGDLTEFQSTLVEEINKKDLLIEDMMNKLFSKEESLYRKFASLETALGRMSAQSAWMAQAFGGVQQ